MRRIYINSLAIAAICFACEKEEIPDIPYDIINGFVSSCFYLTIFLIDSPINFKR